MSEPLSTRINKALVYIANKIKSLYSVTDNLNIRTTQNETSISGLQDSKIDCVGGEGTDITLNGVTVQNNNSGEYIIYNSGRYMYFNNLAVTKGTNPSAAMRNGIIFGDKTAGANSTKTDRMGVIEFAITDTGDTSIVIGTYPNVNGATSYPANGILKMGTSSDGAGFLTFKDKPVIVKIAESKGTNWYRKYSDGWIEQGGIFNRSATATNWSQAITFPIAFSNTNMNIQISSSGVVGDKLGEHGENIESVSVTGFTYYYYTSASVDGSLGFHWTACGY